MADLEDSYAQSIADRESWLRSFGMTPYTTGHERFTETDKENIESRKIHGKVIFHNECLHLSTDGRVSRRPATLREGPW